MAENSNSRPFMPSDVGKMIPLDINEFVTVRHNPLPTGEYKIISVSNGDPTLKSSSTDKPEGPYTPCSEM